MNVRAVKSQGDLKKFITFPYNLHRNTSNWIPPLKLDQKHIFDPKKNAVLNHCDYQLFLLFEKNQIIGRIAAYINHIANDYWNDRIGFFGHYK